MFENGFTFLTSFSLRADVGLVGSLRRVGTSSGTGRRDYFTSKSLERRFRVMARMRAKIWSVQDPKGFSKVLTGTKGHQFTIESNGREEHHANVE